MSRRRRYNKKNEEEEKERKKKKEMKRKKEDELRKKKDDKKRKKDDKKRRKMLFRTSLSLLGSRYHNPDMMKEGLKSMLKVYRSYSNSNSRALCVPDEYKLKFHALLYWYGFCFGKEEVTLLLDSLNDLDDHYKLVFLQQL